MTMAGTSKRRRTARTVVVHQCNQEEVLRRVNLVLFGNGHPEDGLAFLVREFIKSQKDITQDIANIRNDIGELKGDYTRVKSSFERYKAEMNGFEAGKKEAAEHSGKTKVEKRAVFLKILQTIAVILTAIGIGFSAYFGYKNNKGQGVTDSKIDNLGVPVTVTRSGNLYALPDTVEIKMWNLNDTTNTSNDTIK